MFDRYAVAQSRTYLLTYIVLLQEALPQDGKNEIAGQEQLFLQVRLAPILQLLPSDNAMAQACDRV
jgi:hypothetical protein